MLPLILSFSALLECVGEYAFPELQANVSRSLRRGNDCSRQRGESATDARRHLFEPRGKIKRKIKRKRKRKRKAERREGRRRQRRGDVRSRRSREQLTNERGKDCEAQQSHGSDL